MLEVLLTGEEEFGLIIPIGSLQEHKDSWRMAKDLVLTLVKIKCCQLRDFNIILAGGYGDAETSQATEDSFFIDRILYKLNTVEPKFDDNNLMNPWTFTTLPNGKKDFRECEIIFAPHQVYLLIKSDANSSQQTRKALNYLLLNSEIRVVYGQYSGWVTDQNVMDIELLLRVIMNFRIRNTRLKVLMDLWKCSRLNGRGGLLEDLTYTL